MPTSVQTPRDHSPVAAGKVLNWMKMDWIVMVRNCVKAEQSMQLPLSSMKEGGSYSTLRGNLTCSNVTQ